jgi:hypothetical protein
LKLTWRTHQLNRKWRAICGRVMGQRTNQGSVHCTSCHLQPKPSLPQMLIICQPFTCRIKGWRSEIRDNEKRLANYLVDTDTKTPIRMYLRYELKYMYLYSVHCKNISSANENSSVSRTFPYRRRTPPAQARTYTRFYTADSIRASSWHIDINFWDSTY